MAEESYLTIQELAKHFAVSISTVRAWIRTGVLPDTNYLKVANTYRFRPSEVEIALKEHTARAAEIKAKAMARAEPIVDNLDSDL